MYVERSRHDLHDAHAARSGAWCGWAHALNQDRSTCVAPVSPFGNAAVGVAPRAAGGMARCTARRTDAVSGFRLAAAALGALLFWHAPSLALSTPFRLTTGSLGFVALSALILLFVLYRSEGWAPGIRGLADDAVRLSAAQLRCISRRDRLS